MQLDVLLPLLQARVLRSLGLGIGVSSAYQRVLAVQPGNVEALVALGYATAARGEYAAAQRYFESAAQLEPDVAEHHFNIAYLLEQQKLPRAALAAFGEAIRCKENHDRAWYGKGVAHAALGEHVEAAAAFERVCKLQPMNGIAFYQLGMAQHQSEQPDAVRDTATRLAAFDPRHTQLLVRDSGRGDLQELVADWGSAAGK